MSSPTRTQFEDAIHAFVVAASGYAAANVIWSQQNAPRPGSAFIVLRLSDFLQVGQDWTEIIESPADTFTTLVRGMRRVTLQLQAFGGAATGATSPTGALDVVRTKAKLPTLRDALYAGGVGIASFGPLQTIDGVVGASEFEPRAILTASLHLTVEVSELAGYIDTVELAGDDPGDLSVIEEFEVTIAEE